MTDRAIVDGIPQAEPPKAYNRTGEVGPAYRTTPQGQTIAKIDAYGWAIVDQPGTFKLLSKSVLNIDQEYQRTSVTLGRVNRIAGQWSWQKFGCLSVAQRTDGTYYVTDGQHRKLAADKRADIDLLPCIVFKTSSLKEEAKQFLAINEDRGAVKSIDKYRSLVMCEDAAAVAVENMIRSSGYQMADNKGGSEIKHVRCVRALLDAMRTRPEVCHTAWTICTLICGNEYPVSEMLFKAIAMCEGHMIRRGVGSLSDNKNIERLMQVGHNAIIQEISNYSTFHRGRPSAKAEAIITILNKGRRNRIPSAMADSVEE